MILTVKAYGGKYRMFFQLKNIYFLFANLVCHVGVDLHKTSKAKKFFHPLK